MPEESLLTPDVRSLIGRTTPALPVRVTRRAVERTMDIYLGEGQAAPGDGEPVPGFVLAALEGESDRMDLPDVLPDSLLISNEWQFDRPLRLGEELTVSGRLADITERFGGRFGYGLYFRSETEFRDESGEVVARSARTLMQYDTANARDGESA